MLIETKMCSWLFQDGCKPDKSPSVMNNFGLPVQNARHSKCPAAVHCFPPFALRHFRSFTRREVTRHSSQGLVCPCRLLRANEEGGRAGSGFLRPPSSQTSLRVRELHLRWFSNRTEVLRDTLPFHFFLCQILSSSDIFSKFWSITNFYWIFHTSIFMPSANLAQSAVQPRPRLVLPFLRDFGRRGQLEMGGLRRCGCEGSRLTLQQTEAALFHHL